MAINFGAGKGDLFANQMAQRRIFGLCGVGHDGERCLDGVGEVAGLQAGAFGKFAVVLQHGVEFIDQRLDFGGVVPPQGAAPAFVQGAQFAAQAG